ncbi:MAG: hypothetical protein MUE97_05745, partial [Phycisphaerales bacterium]|nr:hypothetical protein [Phycisphaerales bacterium]
MLTTGVLRDGPDTHHAPTIAIEPRACFAPAASHMDRTWIALLLDEHRHSATSLPPDHAIGNAPRQTPRAGRMMKYT